MSKVDIWMPIYIGDYLRDTEELSSSEHGVYLLLLMHYWLKGGEIGADIDRLARVAKTDNETARFILGSYFTLIDGNYKNKRADIEIENANNRRRASTENGKKGGRPPLNNLQKTGRLSVGIPRRNLDHNLRKSSSSSPSPIQEEKKEDKENMDETLQKRFKKPTVTEIQAYCLSRKNNVNAQRFFDNYESKGWKVGNNRMKDWRAAVRTWENNDFSGFGGNGKIKAVERPAMLEMEE